MNLIRQKTQTEIDKETLERSIERSALALAATAQCLNTAWNDVWLLPDDRLQALLQDLVNAGKLEDILTIHYTAATGINSLLQSIEYDRIKCYDFVGREFLIDEFGTVSLKPKESLNEPIGDQQQDLT